MAGDDKIVGELKVNGRTWPVNEFFFTFSPVREVLTFNYSHYPFQYLECDYPPFSTTKCSYELEGNCRIPLDANTSPTFFPGRLAELNFKNHDLIHALLIDCHPWETSLRLFFKYNYRIHIFLNSITSKQITSDDFYQLLQAHPRNQT